MKVDLALLHPPTVFDFRERPILWGPINDLVPSTPIFEMYPLGFVSIASTLEEEGYTVGIINIALRMLSDRDFDPEEYISKIDAELFGIDLHWLPHVHGALNLVRIVKQVHETTPVVFGGHSASYYHREILRDVPEVDFVLRGDSTEKPFLQLMEALDHGNLENVENLSYRQDGRLKENSLTYVPDTLDDYSLDYGCVVKAFMRSKNRLDILPFSEFLERPIMAVLPRKGCEKNCLACGGSRYSYARFCNRKKVAWRSPEKVVEDIKRIAEFKVPAFVLGDIALNHEEYGLKILRGIRDEGLDIPLVFEFFYPPPGWFLDELGRSVDNFSIELSPEVGDEEVRKRIGKTFDNASVRKMVSHAFSNGCQQFDLYFVIGLGFQTRENLRLSAKLAESLIKENPGETLLPFVSPYAPFLDPGSRAFEAPERYGYLKYAHTLLEHYNLLDKGITWKDFLNYSTNHIDKDDIVELSYSTALDFARIKREAEIMDNEAYETIKERIDLSKNMIEEVDRLRKRGRVLESDAVKSISKTELEERLIIDREELDWSGRL
jgi:B12-binding domain/radical SAM domain protein